MVALKDRLVIVRPSNFSIDRISSPDGSKAIVSEELLTGQEIYVKQEIIAQGAVGKWHYHPFLTVIIMQKGTVRVGHGQNKELEDEATAGSVILIPPGMPHRPINRGTEHVVCFIIRPTAFDKICEV